MIVLGSEQHNDLTSFLHYAKRLELAEISTVYVGIHHEYTVASPYRFSSSTSHAPGEPQTMVLIFLAIRTFPHNQNPSEYSSNAQPTTKA